MGVASACLNVLVLGINTRLDAPLQVIGRGRGMCVCLQACMC